ncbi:MAG: DNA polymerase III subunit delta [Acidobacteriota bacterium]
MDLAPAYFFYGEEVFPAFEFIEDVKNKLSSQSQQDSVVEEFELGTDSWADIISSAKTMSLLPSSYRLIKVKIPPRKKQNFPGKEEKLSSSDEKLLRSYLSSPSEKNLLIVVFKQKLKADSPLLKFFRSLPKSSIHIQEFAVLKGKKLESWIKNRIQKEGKKIDLYACKRLAELSGNDLERLNTEIDKLVTFVGEKDFIEVDDVRQVSGWVKSFIKWEITNSLEEANYKKCLFTLDKLMEKENIPPGVIMDEISGFFSDILLTKMRLREGNKDKKSIFKEIKPFIPERYKSLYQRKFKEIIHFAEQISFRDLRYYIEQLKDIDIKMKSTALSFHELMDGFLFEYCQKKSGK